MPENSTVTAPRLEAFLMAEDIRFEKNGQTTLVGVLGDRIFSKTWPFRPAKTCFHVRVRDLEGKVEHHLRLWREDSDSPLAELNGRSENTSEVVSLFNYFVGPGLAFDQPGGYKAVFSLKGESGTVFKAEYRFCIVNPNTEELYVKCEKCKTTFASGVVAESAEQFRDSQTRCPVCGTDNRLSAETAFHLPNPAGTCATET
ncbi:MAG: hypothetical protein R6X20_00280 [Phycisphaerae bacterium]